MAAADGVIDVGDGGVADGLVEDPSSGYARGGGGGAGFPTEACLAHVPDGLHEGLRGAVVVTLAQLTAVDSGESVGHLWPRARAIGI